MKTPGAANYKSSKMVLRTTFVLIDRTTLEKMY